VQRPEAKHQIQAMDPIQLQLSEPPLERMRQLRHLFLRMLLVLVAALLVVALIRWQTTLSLLGRYLIYSEAPESADIILVLAEGFYGPRVLKAAELAKQGYAPLVLISGTPYQSGMEGEYAISFVASEP
jgi:uncharacterized SAM-binding protein YcdF (DUF218 family)